MSTISVNKLSGLTDSNYVELPVASFDSDTLEQVTISGKKKIRVKALPSASVIADSIALDAVTTTKIQNRAVTSVKIAIGGVTAENLATDAVSSANIQSGAVGTEQISQELLDRIDAGSGGGSSDIVLQQYVAEELFTDETLSGSFVRGVWRIRSFNNEEGDAGMIDLIHSGKTLQLGPGSYLIEAEAPGFMVGGHQVAIAKLLNDAATTMGTRYEFLAYGTFELSNSSAVQTRSKAVLKLIIATGVVDLQILHRCQISRNNDGFGYMMNRSASIGAKWVDAQGDILSPDNPTQSTNAAATVAEYGTAGFTGSTPELVKRINARVTVTRVSRVEP